jgi:hypothetical protein
MTPQQARNTIMADLLDLQSAIADARAMGGANLCADGHRWDSDAGRGCPHGSDQCSQAVYRCTVCGEWDYGYAGGPGAQDCERGCSLEAMDIVGAGGVEAYMTEVIAPALDVRDGGK